MQREVALLPPDAAGAFQEALEGGKLAEFATNFPAGGSRHTACRLIVEHAAPLGDSPFHYPIYASFELPALAGGVWRQVRNLSRTVVRQVQLEPGEVLSLLPLFPNLAKALVAQHPELRSVPLTVAPAVDVPDGELAQVAPVPEKFRQRVRSTWYPIWMVLLGLAPVIWLVLGGALIAAGLWLVMDKSNPFGWAVLAVAAICFSWGATPESSALASTQTAGSSRLRSEIGHRTDAVVDPRDGELLLVSLVPRESFAKMKLAIASDLLLLKIDACGSRLLMEGDCDRYSIPAGAIYSCEPQCFFHPFDPQQRQPLWMVRMKIHVVEGLKNCS